MTKTNQDQKAKLKIMDGLIYTEGKVKEGLDKAGLKIKPLVLEGFEEDDCFEMIIEGKSGKITALIKKKELTKFAKKVVKFSN